MSTYDIKRVNYTDPTEKNHDNKKAQHFIVHAESWDSACAYFITSMTYTT